MRYGGFWKRVLAYIIDLIPLGIIGFIVGVASGQDLANPEAMPDLGLNNLVGLLVGVAYFAGFESSSWQATPGKRALGMIVVDTKGRRLLLGRAAGRYFGKILSGLVLLIGYIMVAFTARKQGLHDMLAGTLVVVGEPGDVGNDAAVFE
jgi:uncharacterized RDD family membrane protein YckC